MKFCGIFAILKLNLLIAVIFAKLYWCVSIRLNGGSTKNDQTYTTDRVNNADFKNGLHFFVTSSRPIKAEPKGLKIATFALQNLPEGRDIENNVMKYGPPIFQRQ